MGLLPAGLISRPRRREALSEEYVRRTPGSRKLYARAKRVFAGGVNHNARFFAPHPLFARRAKGANIWDEDGNKYVDYWMGHMALILGHSPPVVVEALEDQIREGTHFGLGSGLAVELGEEVRKDVPCAEMMRFCNTGAEATMYLVRLARAYTGRRTVIKMRGGWHGYNTDLNTGVHRPFIGTEGEGILPEEQAHVESVRFNDLEEAARAVREKKNDVATIFLEPVLGAGGCIPASRDYLRGLRELSDRTGVLLAFDEIITGFRLALGGAQEFFGVTPDLATFGKVVGGGLPIGLVAGRREMVSLADPAREKRFVSIGGGTFSENPLSMKAGLATLKYLRRNKSTLYPRLDEEGRLFREGIDEALLEEGVRADTTGAGSLFMTHFGAAPRNAEEAAGEDGRAARRYALFMISRGHFMLPGHAGAISTAHTGKDLLRAIADARRFAKMLKGQTKGGAKVTA
jgi:glutamate-1-semialdehyde 2,1-aminomutase